VSGGGRVKWRTFEAKVHARQHRFRRVSFFSSAKLIKNRTFEYVRRSGKYGCIVVAVA
jgi:hypothetical protein